eukprot:gene8346-10251_t
MSTSFTSLNQRGRIELARVILYYSEYKFEDNKVESISDELKSTLPTGALPVYKVQDVTLYNPTSIARYLSKKFNLYGSNEIQQTISDEIVDSIWDLLLPLVSAQNESDKLKLKLKLFPQFIGTWEKRINESKSKYISGDSLTFADLSISIALNNLLTLGFTENDLKDFPKVPELVKTVDSIPSIQSYRKNNQPIKI